MAAVAVDVQHAAIEVPQDALDRLPPPLLEVGHRGHVKRVDALADDAAGDPLHHVAARAALHQHVGVEEDLLDQHVEREGELDGPPHHVGRLVESQVGLRGAKELEDEVEPVDQDEVAEAELAPRAGGERLELLAEAAEGHAGGVDPERIEARPVAQQRRDHRRDPARRGIGHVLHVAAGHAAVEPLVALAQIGRGHAVVEHGRLARQVLVPEGQAADGVGAGAVARGVLPREPLECAARRVHHREHLVGRAPRVERTQPAHHRDQVRAVGQRAASSHASPPRSRPRRACGRAAAG